MNTPQLSISDRRIRRSAVLVFSGLAVEIGTLFWVHPIAFVVHATVASGLMGLGVATYLWTQLTASRSPGSR